MYKFDNYLFLRAPEKILSKNLSNNLMKYYFAAKPMNDFLQRALRNR
jgi:hypothetical protein